jgi:flagellar biogenesis protein FliO
MSAMGERATQARSGIGDLESALERTDKVLAAAEKADEVASGKGRTFMKLLLVLTVIGVTVLVVRKLVGGGSSDPEPYRSQSGDS